MEPLYWLVIFALSWPWWRDMRDAWRQRRVVRRECRLLDEELDLL